MEQRRVHRKSQTNRDQYCDALQHLDLDTGTEAHVTNVTNVPRYLLVKAGAAGRPGAGMCDQPPSQSPATPGEGSSDHSESLCEVNSLCQYHVAN